MDKAVGKLEGGLAATHPAATCVSDVQKGEKVWVALPLLKSLAYKIAS